MLKTILSNISKIETTLAETEGQIEKVIEPYKEIIELLETIPGVAYNGAIGKGVSLYTRININNMYKPGIIEETKIFWQIYINEIGFIHVLRGLKGIV
ncbi:MAG: hypothetical protein KGY70_09255, partial [Bacteroidales bacterium]|nr:hypothetical protein [Bacteroidales bacterium]